MKALGMMRWVGGVWGGGVGCGCRRRAGRRDGMKALGMMRWAGLAATVGGMFMVFSDLLNLTVYVPGLGEAAPTGYQAVGAGGILLALTLLFVGVVGPFSGAPPP